MYALIFFVVGRKPYRQRVHAGHTLPPGEREVETEAIPLVGGRLTPAAMAECRRRGIRWATWSLPPDTSRTYITRRAKDQGGSPGKPTAREGRHTWRPVPVLT
jgi:alkanesulfonate monooxygenase SsuD/methylene tetrahydromethanopterin reductase-like flavin-dependent oxidoreductase (luciferase family)